MLDGNSLVSSHGWKVVIGYEADEADVVNGLMLYSSHFPMPPNAAGEHFPSAAVWEVSSSQNL